MLIATIYVAISVPLNASFHGQTCCYPNDTYLPHFDPYDVTSYDAIDDALSQMTYMPNISNLPLDNKSASHTTNTIQNNSSREEQSQGNEQIHSSFYIDNNQSSIPFNRLKQSTEWKSNFPDKRTSIRVRYLYIYTI